MAFRIISRVMALVLAAIMMSVCISVCAEQTTVYAAVEDAIVYDAEGNNIATLPLNTPLTLTGVRRGICRVTMNGYIAYMSKSELSLKPVAAETPDASPGITAYVKKQGAKVYDERKNVIATLGMNDAVTVTAKKGPVCRILTGDRAGYMYFSDLSRNKVEAESAAPAPAGSAIPPARGTAREMDWWDSDIQKIFARGVVAQITDVETGLSWRERRNGGTNHADCQPLTAADTAAMKKAYGGKWSWDRGELRRLHQRHAPRGRFDQGQQFQRTPLHPFHQQPHPRQQQGVPAASGRHTQGNADALVNLPMQRPAAKMTAPRSQNDCGVLQFQSRLITAVRRISAAPG